MRMQASGQNGNVTVLTLCLGLGFLVFTVLFMADMAAVLGARRMAVTAADAGALAAQHLWQQAADKLAESTPPASPQDAACLALTVLQQQADQIGQGTLAYASANGAQPVQGRPLLILEPWNEQQALRVVVAHPLHLIGSEDRLDDAHRQVSASAHAHLYQVRGIRIDWNAPCVQGTQFSWE